jgi:hypothetical protein
MGFFKQYGQELRELQDLLNTPRESGKVIKYNFFASYWSVKEVAAFLGISEETVNHRKAGTRTIPCYRFGDPGKRQTLRFKAGDVIAFREKIEGKCKTTYRQQPNGEVLHFSERLAS